MQQTSASAAPASAPLPDEERPWNLAAFTMLAWIGMGQVLFNAGLAVLVPLGTTLLVAGVLHFGMRRLSGHLRVALALIGGHALWFTYDLASGSARAGAPFYAAIASGLFLWLLLRPGVASFVVMGLWLLLQLGLFGLALLEQPVGTRTHTLIVIHAALLASSIVALVVAFVQMRWAGALRVALPAWLAWRRPRAARTSAAGDTRDPDALLRDLLLQPAADLERSPPGAPTPEPRPPRRKPLRRAELSESGSMLPMLAGIIGFQLFRSAGIVMLPPAALFFLIGIAIDRWGPPRARLFAASIGAACGYLLLQWIAAPESAHLWLGGALLVAALAGALMVRPLMLPTAGLAVALAGYALTQSIAQLDRYPALAPERDDAIVGDFLLIIAIIGAVVGCVRAYDVPLRWRRWRDGQGKVAGARQPK